MGIASRWNFLSSGLMSLHFFRKCNGSLLFLMLFCLYLSFLTFFFLHFTSQLSICHLVGKTARRAMNTLFAHTLFIGANLLFMMAFPIFISCINPIYSSQSRFAPEAAGTLYQSLQPTYFPPFSELLFNYG